MGVVRGSATSLGARATASPGPRRPGGAVPARPARLLAVLVLAGLFLSFPAQAQQPGSAVGDQQQYAYRELSAISGIITASTMEVWFTSPVEAFSSSDHSFIGFNVAGPDIPTGGVATFTASTIATSGCTVGSWTTVSETLAAGTGATSYAQVNLTSSDCSGVAEMSISAGVVPVTLGRFRFPFNIHVPPTSFTNTLSGSIGTVVSGSLNNTVSGSLAATIAAWPTLFAQVNVTSWPALAAILSGNVTVDVADDTTDDGQLTVPTSNINATTIVENATFNSNTTFPERLELSGQVDNEVSTFWFPIMFWGAMLALCYVRKWTYAFWSAFPGLINVLLPNLFPAPLNDFTTLFMVFVGGCIAQLWAERAEQREGTWN